MPCKNRPWNGCVSAQLQCTSSPTLGGFPWLSCYGNPFRFSISDSAFSHPDHVWLLNVALGRGLCQVCAVGQSCSMPSCLLLLSCPGVKSTYTSSSYLVLTVLCSLYADGSVAKNDCFVSGLGSISLFLEYLPPLRRIYLRSASQKFCREVGNAISFKQQCRDPPKVRCTVFDKCSAMAVLPNKEMWMWRQV